MIRERIVANGLWFDFLMSAHGDCQALDYCVNLSPPSSRPAMPLKNGLDPPSSSDPTLATQFSLVSFRLLLRITLLGSFCTTDRVCFLMVLHTKIAHHLNKLLILACIGLIISSLIYFLDLYYIFLLS